MIDKKDVKLLVAVPCYDTAEAEFLRSYTKLLLHLVEEGYNFEVKFEIGTLIYLARENMVHYAVRNGFTHVLWVDCDMVFEPDVVDKLFALDKPFVAAAFRSRHNRYVCCFSQDIVTCSLMDELPDEPFWADACGFALVLMETKVLIAVRHRYGACFEADVSLGEDFLFCKKALGCGYKVYVDPKIQAGHIARYPIWPDNIDLIREYEKRER